MWKCIVDRLLDAYDCIANIPETPIDSIHQLVMIVYHLLKLKVLCSYASIFARLVASLTIVCRLREFHAEITFLQRDIDPDSVKSADSSWESQSATGEIALVGQFREKVDGPVPFQLSLEKEEDQVQAALLLQYTLRIHGDTCSQEMSDLLVFTLDKALEVVNAPVPHVPEWFIPPHELDPNHLGGSRQVTTRSKVVRGKWSSSAVMICHHPQMPRTKFTELVAQCFQLSHSNVVKLFGASHLRPPFTAVFENVSSTNLREYLSSEETRHLLWQKLCEVSLGLKYLHECGVILESLRCDDIWAGTDGIAKVNAFRCIALPDDEAEDKTECARWQAPETLRGDATSAASNIYSLGMCVLETLTKEVPWGAEASDIVTSKVQVGHRPKFPEGMTITQGNLFEQMRLADPMKRPTISSVVEHLKQFADDQKAQQQSQGRFERSQSRPTTGQYDLERFIFPELGSTLDMFIKNLVRKSDSRSDSREAALYIFDRLLDVHDILQSQHRLPKAPSSEKLVLLRAKSQKVSLRSNVLHRRIDEVLELLALPTVDPIHSWQTLTNEHDAAEASQDTVKQVTKAGDGVVQIVRFGNDNLNQRFKELDFDAIKVAATDELAQHPPWFIAIHELKYERGVSVGVGSVGEVFMATWLGTSVVIKFMGYEADGTEYDRVMFFHELRVWFPLSHPHVVRLFDACYVGKRYFACEFAGNGTLIEYLKRDENAHKTWTLLYQVGLGLQHLHEQNILHNDLKCDNVLIGSDGDAKLTDFGLSCILDSAEVKIDTKKQGEQQWRFPEYLRGDQRLTLASDIYEFGMTILESVTGEPPWGRSAMDVVVRMRVKKGMLPPRPAGMSNSQWNLIKMMCVSDPAQRVKISFVVEKLHEISQQHLQQQDSRLEKAIVSDSADQVVP